MLNLKFKVFENRQSLCEFVNSDGYIQIVQIVEKDNEFILYYKKDDDLI